MGGTVPSHPYMSSWCGWRHIYALCSLRVCETRVPGGIFEPKWAENKQEGEENCLKIRHFRYILRCSGCVARVVKKSTAQGVLVAVLQGMSLLEKPRRGCEILIIQSFKE
jgi:hypothetical protein